MTRPRAAVLACGCFLLVGAGCTQVAQLQPVAGDAVTSVRIATIDVLAGKGVSVVVAPTCTFQGKDYSCQGTATDGRQITSTAKEISGLGETTNTYGVPAQPDITLTVLLGADLLYKGTVQDVLDDHGQVPQP